MKKTIITTEDYLRKTQLPLATKSYTVIAHGDVIDAVRTKLADNGFIVKNELYKAEYAGEIGFGFMEIENEYDPDMSMTFNWTNSYNKMVRFGCSIGGFIYDNQVPFITSNNHAGWIRKHTGIADSESMNVIDVMISSAKEHFAEIVKMKDNFKSIEVSRKEYAKLIGLLYLDKHILTANQVSLLRKEYDKPSFKYNDQGTLWELYKMIMFAISDQPPKNWYKQQIALNDYIQVMYQYANEDVANEAEATQLQLDIINEEDAEHPAEEEIKECIDEVIAQYPKTPEESFIQATEEDVVHELYGVDNDIEVSVEAPDNFITDEMEDEIMDQMFVPILPTPKAPCAAHDSETVKDEMESIDNLIQAQNLIQDAKAKPIEEEILFEFDTVEPIEDSAGFTFEDNFITEPVQTIITDEQIEIIKEEYGVIEKGNPDDGLIGSVVEEDNDLFGLLEEDEVEENEVPWIEDQPVAVESVPSIVPKELQEEVSDILSTRYNNEKQVVESHIGDDYAIFELESGEFFVVEK